MDDYYVNKNQQETGEHEVHKDGCKHMPLSHNRTYLGKFLSCKGAIIKAKEKYKNVDGCYYCANACHTR